MLGGIRLSWEDTKLLVSATRLREQRDGAPTAELSFKTTAPGAPGHLYQAQLNLISTQSKTQMINLLTKRYDEINWVEVIEQVCHHVREHIRAGEPVVEISTEDPVDPPEYLVFPLLPKRLPTVLYGLGGVGKSLLALAVGVCVQLPWTDNPLRLDCEDRLTNVLYCDWETDRSDIAWRLKCLERGMRLPAVSIRYRRCVQPLADDLEKIQEAINDHNIGCVIIDSIARAAGGDLNATDPADRLYRAVRALNVSCLLLAHTAKGSGELGKQTSIYGNAFYTNNARSVWEVKKVQEAGQDDIEVGLFHRKSNVSRLHKPLAYRITFSDDRVTIRYADVRGIAEFADGLPLRERILTALNEGPLTATDLAKAVGASPNIVRARLSDLYRLTQLVRVGDRWDLAGRNGNT